MSHRLIPLAMATAMTISSANAGQSLDLTIYHSDNASLFSSSGQAAVKSGYAMVHEQRTLDLKAGRQTVNIDGLPAHLDTEALDLRFAGHAAVSTEARRLLLLPGNTGLLGTHLGEQVVVYGDSGQQLAQGTLLAAGNDLLIDAGQGGTLLVHDYATVHFSNANVHGGARLQVAIKADHAGQTAALLDYPSGGIGWRAAYVGVLNEAKGQCHMQFSSNASIANRSGRDWPAASLKLLAGEPNLGKSPAAPPRMMRTMATPAMVRPSGLPEQAGMGDYRSYTISGSIDLPNDSITQVPLYASRPLDCQRSWVYENGSAWSPAKPQLQRDFNTGSNDRLSSRLHFQAFDNLPAGYLRVISVIDGQHELLGEARIADTPQDRPVDVQLGTPFELRGQHERTGFVLDKAARTLHESFRISLSNAGDSARTVTVREHPNRWRNWKLQSSSLRPVKQTADSMDFQISVPAHGTASLTYSIQYNWTQNNG